MRMLNGNFSDGNGGKRMNSFFTRNVTAKVLSILFALVLWIYVMSDVNPRETRTESNVQVQLMGIEDIRSQGLVIEGSNSFTISVKLTGRRDEVYKISRNDIKAVADIRGYRVGTNSIPVEITAPQGIEIDYSPKFIKLELEEIVKRQKEVSLVITGSPPEGYVVGEAEFKPTIVWVEGPESSVNSIERIIAKLEVIQDTVNISASLPLKAVNSKGAEVTNIDIKSSYIDVVLPIDRVNQIRIEPDISITTQEGYEIIEIAVVPQQVSLRGQDEIIKQITVINTEKISKENITENFEAIVPLKVPEGVTVLGEPTVKVRVSVQRITEQTYNFSRDNIIFTNLRRGLNVNKSSIPETIEVRITAPQSVIQSIAAKDIQLVADLKEFDTGQHSVNLVVVVPSVEEAKIRSITINPKQVNLKLEANN